MRLTPWMSEQEVSAMRTVLERCRPQRVLEWGAGGSTVYWATLFPEVRWTAVESDERWYQHVKRHMPGNVELRWRLPRDYVNSAYWSDGLEQYDLAIIDGIRRKDCFSFAPHLVRPGGGVLIHDWGAKGRYRQHWEQYAYIETLCAGGIVVATQAGLPYKQKGLAIAWTYPA